MGSWSVFKTKIEIFPHTNADSLELGKVGSYQVVVQKGLYNDGDEVLFAPKNSIIPENLRDGFPHLKGANKDRVGQVRLRGELSEGIILPLSLLEGREVDYGEDVSEILGITLYEPPIPTGFGGVLKSIPPEAYFSSHDVEQFGIYSSDFSPDENVVVTEKIHGSQVNISLFNGEFYVTSKGLLGKNVHIEESLENIYWQGVRNTGVFEKMFAFYEQLGKDYEDSVIQVIGEVVPAQGGNWTYGFTKPHILAFDLRIDGQSVRYADVPEYIKDIWVPVLYSGPFSGVDFQKLSKGREQVSGKELHIREGIVLRPEYDRRAKDGTRLMVKVINPKYASGETGDEIT